MSGRVGRFRRSRGFAVGLVTAATFIDLVAYSVAFPVLPDFARRLGASPTLIGLLFASFGVTLLAVSLPMGAVSDRIGRRVPLIGGLVTLAIATALFAFSRSLPWLFGARLLQGAADAITWVVGFALVADLYGPAERGRVMGLVMSGTSFGVMIGPSIGGWLYQFGGIELPFLGVAAAAALIAAAFLFLQLPAGHADAERVPMRAVLRAPAVAACAATVVAGAATLAMLEPVLPLFLALRLGLDPARIGLLFGLAAVASTTMPPVYGRLVDRWGGRRLTFAGLVLTACGLPLLALSWSTASAGGFIIMEWAMAALIITPSLAYMAEAVSAAGVRAYGVAYGVYNVAWACGLLAGPAIGGFLFERIGFEALALVWAPTLIL
ncbi:MAG TPA: MFS transporter, partial [Vicinamibacterales bacterium]|nr:MFS transporter [Vicinamibacterales bacterium]